MHERPLRNRVTPFGELIAVPERGSLMGNRGILHDGHRRIVRFNQGRRWISCVTEYPGRRRTPMTPGRYTELFFLDEATALAAGHRPCHECRREEALRFRDAWTRAQGADPGMSFAEVDRRLHRERLEGRERMRRWRTDAASLPDGAMLAIGETAFLVRGDGVAEWTPGGYRAARPRPAGEVEVLTPRSIVAALPDLSPLAAG